MAAIFFSRALELIRIGARICRIFPSTNILRTGCENTTKREWRSDSVSYHSRCLSAVTPPPIALAPPSSSGGVNFHPFINFRLSVLLCYHLLGTLVEPAPQRARCRCADKLKNHPFQNSKLRLIYERARKKIYDLTVAIYKN